MKKINTLLLSAVFISGVLSAEIIYSNDFSGTGKIYPGEQLINVSIDGSGCLRATAPIAAFLRIPLNEQKIASAGALKATVKMTSVKKTENWLGFGFTGVKSSAINRDGGPWMLVRSTYLAFRSGMGATSEPSFPSAYGAGDSLTVEMIYNIRDNKVDVILNGKKIRTGFPVNYTVSGAPAKPALKFFQLQFYQIDDTGCFDSVTLETIE